jgi:hypothetical protein
MRFHAVSRLMDEVQITEPEKLRRERRLLEDGGAVSHQQLVAFEHSRRERRESLTLYDRPVDTLRIFSKGCWSALIAAVKYIFLHSISLYVIIPSIMLRLLLKQFPGPHNFIAEYIDFVVLYVIWWVGLGILSSIGLGTGLQSGVLFLYPHVIKICFAAHACQNLDFESETDMWFQTTNALFRCTPTDSDSTPVTMFGLWRKIILACFLQSAGTAIGEIPPYWMTRVSRIAAIEAGAASAAALMNPNVVPEEVVEAHHTQWNFVEKIKVWMVKYLRTHGFYGVLLMASFPNILFDVCGICCGYFLMPFWTFFSATFLGKAVIRNSYQAVIYVFLCR